MKITTISHLCKNMVILSILCFGVTVHITFAQDITTGLVAHWALDGMPGDSIAVNSVNPAMNGSLVNFGDLSSAWVPGRIGNALKFDEVDDMVEVITDEETVFGDILESFSITGWFCSFAATDYQGIISATHDDENDYDSDNFLAQIRTGSVGFESNTLFTGNTFTANINVVDSTWHHLAVVVEYASVIELYLDGELANTMGAINPLIFTDQNRFRIGRRWVRGAYMHPFNGMIDDIRIYNIPLLQEDIQNIMNATTPIKQVNLQGIPENYSLSQNFPNPFNPTTNISYSIPEAGFVSLKIFDLLGREIRTLVSKVQTANTYSIRFDASGLPSGIYFYKLQAGNGFVETKKMSLLR